MIRLHIRFAPVLIFAAVPQFAQAQATAVDPMTMNAATCAVARSAGDLRWAFAVLEKKVKIEASLSEGVVGNAMTAALQDCPITGINASLAIRAARSFMRFHPRAQNATRPNDALAECLARTAKTEALLFVESFDRNYKFRQNNDEALKAMFAASTGCGTELSKLGDQTQANELYSRINWILRAAPALDHISEPLPGMPK